LLFTKTRDVTSPTRAHDTDAGIDFFIPNYSEDFINDLRNKNTGRSLGFDESDNAIYIPAHGSVLIPAGIKVKVPDGLALVAFNKSGVASKKQLVTGACVVDIGYTGEVHINVINTTSQAVKLTCGEKLMQFVLLQVDFSNPVEVSEIEYNKHTMSDRGEGGFGSSNK
tara:strand:+ start:6834 stop:7337 length:504 start_codon:yes stop_codon:yes gene_type:complete